MAEMALRCLFVLTHGTDAPNVTLMKRTAACLLLAACSSGPTVPVAPPAILFTNGCAVMAAFDLYTDGIARGMYVLGPGEAVEKSVTAGPHAVEYLALSLEAVPLAVHGDTLTVTGPTPYRMACHQA